MKKTALLLSLSLLAATQLLAQSKTMKTAVNWNNAPHKLVKSILQGQLQSHSGGKTTLSKERLISSDYSYDNFTTFEDDSVRYSYSGDRGSTFDLNEMKYNFPATPYDYDIPLAPVSYYLPHTMAIMCDTAYGMDIDSTGHYHTSRTTYATYDANNNLLSYYNINADTTIFPDIHYANSFDASNRITSNISFSHSSTWDTSAARYFTYNSSGRLIIDSLYTYGGGSRVITAKYTYAYDGSGNVIGVSHYAWNAATSSWDYNVQYDLTYYSGGNLQTILISEDTGTGMHKTFKDTIGYTSGYNYFTHYKEFEYSDTGRTLTLNINKHINSAGVPDSVITGQLIYFYTGSGVFAQIVNFQDIYYYNTYNDPVTWIENINFGSGYVYNSLENYFYQVPASVPDVAAQQDVNIYPNPTTDAVNIRLGAVAVGKDVTVIITNISGQVVKVNGMTYNAQSIQIPVSDLAAGTYLVYVKETKGSLLRVQKLIKQ